MRIVIFSDVHSNLEALEAFLEEADVKGADSLFCLGDSIGYGPNPNECLELIRGLGNATILLGNHEWSAMNLAESEWRMNPVAFRAIVWTSQRLTGDNFSYINNLPLMAEWNSYCFYHSSAFEPEKWDYIWPGQRFKSKICLDFAPRRIVCVGHTHQPMLLDDNGDQVLFMSLFSDGTTYLDTGQSRLILNPGSIGQPRGGFADPSYVTYDSETRKIVWRRILNYNPSVTAEKMLSSGLPAELAYYLTGLRQ